MKLLNEIVDFQKMADVSNVNPFEKTLLKNHFTKEESSSEDYNVWSHHSDPEMKHIEVRHFPKSNHVELHNPTLKSKNPNWKPSKFSTPTSLDIGCQSMGLHELGESLNEGKILDFLLGRNKNKQIDRTNEPSLHIKPKPAVQGPLQGPPQPHPKPVWTDSRKEKEAQPTQQVHFNQNELNHFTSGSKPSNDNPSNEFKPKTGQKVFYKTPTGKTREGRYVSGDGKSHKVLDKKSGIEYSQVKHVSDTEHEPEAPKVSNSMEYSDKSQSGEAADRSGFKEGEIIRHSVGKPGKWKDGTYLGLEKFPNAHYGAKDKSNNEAEMHKIKDMDGNIRYVTNVQKRNAVHNLSKEEIAHNNAQSRLDHQEHIAKNASLETVTPAPKVIKSKGQETPPKKTLGQIVSKTKFGPTNQSKEEHGPKNPYVSDKEFGPEQKVPNKQIRATASLGKKQHDSHLNARPEQGPQLPDLHDQPPAPKKNGAKVGNTGTSKVLTPEENQIKEKHLSILHDPDSQEKHITSAVKWLRSTGHNDDYILHHYNVGSE